jgi:caffeoyl-CoA O-methyltransferase
MDIVDPRIARYAAGHTTPPADHLADVAAATRERLPVPQMMSGVVEARLLEAIVVASAARRVLEIGTFTGYGAISIAARLGPDGRVTTIEYDEDLAAIAREHIDASPYAARIDLVRGDAREIVDTLDGLFDLVFVDAWKSDYLRYYEAVLPKLAERGLIVCDNVLWSGGVLETDRADADTRALHAFNEQVQADDRVHNALLTVGDGLMLIWRAG